MLEHALSLRARNRVWSTRVCVYITLQEQRAACSGQRGSGQMPEAGAGAAAAASSIELILDRTELSRASTTQEQE